MRDDRSGVFIVQDSQQHLIALWAGVYQARSQREQSSELENQYPTMNVDDRRALFERDSRCRVHVEHTPRGVPVVLSKRGVRILTNKKLREFQMEHQCFCYPIPRSFVEALAESEHGQPWIQLTTRQKLQLLDVVAILYSFPCKQACQHRHVPTNL